MVSYILTWYFYIIIIIDNEYIKISYLSINLNVHDLSTIFYREFDIAKRTFLKNDSLQVPENALKSGFILFYLLLTRVNCSIDFQTKDLMPPGRAGSSPVNCIDF